jgi:hypothetical protein
MTKTLIRIIAVLEIIGGVCGIGYVAQGLVGTPFNAFLMVLTPFVVGIYVLSLVAGVALWRGSAFGRNAAIIVQAIQVPKLISPPIIFIFSFGFDLWVHCIWSEAGTTVGFELKLLAFNQFFINMWGASVGLGVSITAVIFLIVLVRYTPRTDSAVYSSPPPPPPPSGLTGSPDVG